MKGISGYLVTRNCIELDYCFVEAIKSLIPLCDEIVACDSDSSDGTLQVLETLCLDIHNLRIVYYPFVEAVGDRQWYDRWLNFTRSQLRYDTQFQLDADEVLGAEDHDKIRESAANGECRFIGHVNFFRNAHQTTKYGSGKFARLAPANLYMPSHGEIPVGEQNIRERAEGFPAIGKIYHYGMIRKPSAFKAKQRFMLRTLEGMNEESLDNAAQIEEFLLRETEVFNGQQPTLIEPWLRERGYE